MAAGPRVQDQLSGGGASVWCALVEEADPGDFEAMLSPDELARAAKFRLKADRGRFMIARGLLRRLLGECLNADPAAVELAYEPDGKPRVAADGAELRFSVSHSNDAVVMAFCLSREIGIDIERVRNDLALGEIARRLPSEAAAEIERRAGDDRVREFFRAWVRAEAYTKARGGGLNLIGETPDPGQWWIADLALLDGYAAAVAVEGDAPVQLSTNVISSEVFGGAPRLALE